MGTKKTKLKSTAKKVISKLTGKKTGGRKRSHGPTYWANKVLVEKLKKKYHRLKFGGR